MKLKAFVVSPQSLRRLLTTLGDRAEAPRRAAPRAPPYFQTLGVVRQQAHAEAGEAQADLFDPPA